MSSRGRKGRCKQQGEKVFVRRHGNAPAKDADRQERAYESAERQAGQRQCASGLLDWLEEEGY